MKKGLFLLVACALCGCSQNKYGKQGEDVVNYVYDHIKITGFTAKSVSIEAIDTLLSDDRINFGMIEFESTYSRFMANGLSTKEYKVFLDSVIRHTYDIDYSWMSKEKNDSMRMLEKYVGSFRKVYTVRVETDSKTQPTMTVRVLCENDGNPRMFESQFLLKIQRLRERAENIYLAL